MEAYLDNAATTKPYQEVIDIMEETMHIAYGNPSSLHQKGVEAENYIKYTAGILAKTMKVQPKEIIFTSGGTESNNQALIGAAMANRRKGTHIITTCLEHPSVSEPLSFLQEMGFRISYLPVDRKGHVNGKQLEDEIGGDTILISILYVNNEIGSVQDIASLASVAKQKKQDVLFHTDAIQAYGKYPIYPSKMGIDLLSASGHKIHGPKGSGFLYVKDKVKIKPILYGGGQQRGVRSGTENVSAIAGLGKAAEITYQNYEKKKEQIYHRKRLFMKEIENGIEAIQFHGIEKKEWKDRPIETLQETAPHIISVGFEGIRAEVLLHALEERKIYVSSGSACSSNHPSISTSLQAIGTDKKYFDSTLRFSFSVWTTEEEILYCSEVLKELVPLLRKYTRY